MLGKKKNDRTGDGLRLFGEALAEAGRDVFLLVRADDLFPVYVSGNFERVFLLPPARIEDDIEALFRLTSDETRFQVRRALSAWDRQGPVTFPFPFVPDGGAEGRATRCTVTPVREGRYFLVAFDDAEQEEARVRDLEDRVRDLSSDAQIKADFLNQMSHEIRTPLNGIIGMLSLARDHVDQRSELLDDLDKVDELGGYLLSLVNDILDMSRIESGKVELERRPFDLVAFAEELDAMFQNNAAERRIAYSVDVKECEDLYLEGDRLRFSQVLVNLVSNALKFTPADGTGSVAVTFKEMYRAGDTVRLMVRVRDTGKGMDPQFLGRVFRPFEQEDASIAHRYGGSGLGMAIADSLVRLMGGEIVVDSEVGRGSDFTLYLPFDRAEGPVAEEGAPPCTSDSLSPFFGLRVLVAEDNDVNAKITCAVLAKRGAQVERARDGKEAVDLFDVHGSGHYDVVLMDIRMPVMDGWEAARRIRALEGEADPPVVLVALSANAYVEDARRSRELGMDGHVGKPIDFDELEGILYAAARRSVTAGPQAQER